MDDLTTGLKFALMLRRVLAFIATLLLGGALAFARVVAFTGQMLSVTKAALAGAALLVVVKLLPRRDGSFEGHTRSSVGASARRRGVDRDAG